MPELLKREYFDELKVLSLLHIKKSQYMFTQSYICVGLVCDLDLQRFYHIPFDQVAIVYAAFKIHARDARDLYKLTLARWHITAKMLK